MGYINQRLWSYRLHRQSLSRRKLWEIIDDYEYHLGGYCAEYARAHPEQAAVAARWRKALDRFLFWALAYEIALHAHTRSARTAEEYRTVFDIADYRLDPGEVRVATRRMQQYCRGPWQAAASFAMRAMIRLRMTWPLGWASAHASLMRRVIGLR